MKKKKIAKYIQEAETPIKPKVLYDKVTWGDMLTENEKTFLRNVLEDESHSKDEGLGIAIEAFALSHTATRENITLVEKFLDEGSFIFKFIPYFMVVAFLLILLLSPVLPNAGIDNISHNVLHISYLKGRIIFAIIILIFHT